MTQFVDVIILGESFVIDVDASAANGMFDQEAENAETAINAVRAAIKAGNPLIDQYGHYVLIVHPAVAYRYRRP